jgi:LmbE family N-acetylglucosaminyl deacetylase
MSPNRLTLMGVYAHPDDESFGAGGTLSRYAADGCDVYVVTATRGEAGEISDPGISTNANLPLIREQELRCACRAYGINPPIFLDYIDGQLPIVHQGQAVAKVVRLIREIRPHVVITFGPDGAYGHYDHIAAHRWATIAVNLAADPACFPGQIEDACQPHKVSKLYYNAVPQERLVEMQQGDKPAAVMMDGVPFYFAGRRPEEITTVIDISAFARKKLEGIRCHATQIKPDSPFARDPEEVLRSAWFKNESYILAGSIPDATATKEADLFAGLK